MNWLADGIVVSRTDGVAAHPKAQLRCSYTASTSFTALWE